MKKILFLFLMCALLPRVAGAQGTPTDDTFTVSDLTWNQARDCYVFTVSLEGSRIYTACNLDIFLPNGINVLSSGGKYRVMIASDNIFVYDDWEGTYSHSVSASMPNTQQLRVACSSNTNTEFTATSGKLFDVYVTIDESAFNTCFSPKPIVKLSGLNLTTSAAVKYVPADFACRPFTTGIPTARTIPVNVSAANKIGTLIVPFDAELPSGLKAYSCDATEGDLLTLTPAASIEACTPYIVYAPSGYSGNLSGTAELSDDSNVTDIFTDGYLTGVLTGTTISTGYILQNQGDGPKFYDAEGVTFSLPAGRCYLTPSGSSVKAFCFNFDDATGIEEFQVTPLPYGGGAGGEALYDLSGRSVSNPTHGVYIKGTRKVVAK